MEEAMTKRVQRKYEQKNNINEIFVNLFTKTNIINYYCYTFNQFYKVCSWNYYNSSGTFITLYQSRKRVQVTLIPFANVVLLRKLKKLWYNLQNINISALNFMFINIFDFKFSCMNLPHFPLLVC